MFSQEKQIFSGDFLLLDIKIRYSDDDFGGGKVIIFLDSNIEKYTVKELFADFKKNQKVFYNKILNYPKIDFNTTSFYYQKPNEKRIIEDSFYKLAEQLPLDSNVFITKTVEVIDPWVKKKVEYTYTIRHFITKAYFVKHEVNKNYFGCFKLSLTDDGFLFISGNDQENFVYFPVK